MPILIRKVPAENRQVKAEQIMNKNVISLKCVDTLRNIYNCIKTPHSAFPVLNMQGQVIGLISKHFLITLLEKKQYYDTSLMKGITVQAGILKRIAKKMSDDEPEPCPSDLRRNTHKLDDDSDRDFIDKKGGSADIDKNKQISSMQQEIKKKFDSKIQDMMIIVQKKYDFNSYYNYDIFPNMKNQLDFSHFTVNFEGKDKVTTQQLKEQC